MTLDVSLVARLLAEMRLSQEEFEAARHDREPLDEPENGAEADSPDAETPDLTLESVDDVGEDAVVTLVDRMSTEAKEFIVFAEVTSRRFYERYYQKPIWPGGWSGVTIGIGYDVGANSRQNVEQVWGPHLPASDVEALARATGLHGEPARAALESVRHVRVPWETAISVFYTNTLPRYAALAARAFPGSDALHPHCFGAIVSVVYNRGARMRGHRRRHMKQIRDLIVAGGPENLARVPHVFREMAELWADSNLPGLIKRRFAEAELFQNGLEAMAAAAMVPPAEPGAATEDPAALEALAQFDGDGRFYEEDDDATLAAAPFEAEAPWDRVSWAEDAASPDYAHLGPIGQDLVGKDFSLDVDALKALIHANAFTSPKMIDGRFVFALRGAQLLDQDLKHPVDAIEDVAALTLRDARPDHRTFRCVIGVCDVTRGRLSGFAASTAPNARALWSYAQNQRSGNMLLTGRHEFTVFWHQYSKAHKRVPGCLSEGGRLRAVLRNTDDLRYDVSDRVRTDRITGDNVHPGFADRSAEFSSWGCLVVKGTFHPRGHVNGAHIGPWGRFRSALGLAPTGVGDHGREVDVILVTGLEAAIAARLQTASSASDRFAPLRRLRQGSRGPRVERLQTRLGVRPDGAFGPLTAQRLADLQKERGLAVDTVYAPALDDALGFDVFAAPATARGTSLPELTGDVAAAGGGALEALGGADAHAIETWRAARLAEITLRARASRLQGDALASVGPTLESFEAVDDLLAIGRRILRRVERSLMLLLCGDADDDQADRERIKERLRSAAEYGAEALVAAVADALRLALGGGFIANTAAELIVDSWLSRRLANAATSEIGQAIELRVTDVCVAWIQHSAARD